MSRLISGFLLLIIGLFLIGLDVMPFIVRAEGAAPVIRGEPIGAILGIVPLILGLRQVFRRRPRVNPPAP